MVVHQVITSGVGRRRLDPGDGRAGGVPGWLVGLGEHIKSQSPAMICATLFHGLGVHCSFQNSSFIVSECVPNVQLLKNMLRVGVGGSLLPLLSWDPPIQGTVV